MKIPRIVKIPFVIMALSFAFSSMAAIILASHTSPRLRDVQT